MGDGTARAWLVQDGQGSPVALDFTLSPGALDQLPAAAAGTAFLLDLPGEAAQKTPFKHIMINSKPRGHEPAAIYGVPHFDFHFFMMPVSEAMQIPPYDQSPATFDHDPAAYLPAGYVKSPGGVPGMECHWLDAASPEFHGQPFTETFVYGCYNGHVTFWELMVALSYLKSLPAALEEDLPEPAPGGKTDDNPVKYRPKAPAADFLVKQPAQYETPGYYPTHYSIRPQADGSYQVALSQFVER